MNVALIDRLLTAYSYLPAHPGKGRVYDRFVPQLNLSDKRIRTRYGVTFECDMADKVEREIYWTGFNPRDVRILNRLITPGMVVLDAGANIGYFSLLCAKWLHDSGQVYSFEPFPQSAEKLRKNQRLNPKFAPRIELHQIALSNFIGAASMDEPEKDNAGCNHLALGLKGPIAVTTLDAWVEYKKISRVDLIKVDIEGAELAFLDGAVDSIKRFRPILMIEVNESTLVRFGSTSVDLLGRIKQLGYSVFEADRFGFNLIPLPRIPGMGEEPNVYAFPVTEP
jgi:FkbM family methyltransferase